MKVHVVFPARSAEIVGRHFIEAELPDNATLKDLIEYIGKHYSPRFSRGVLEGRLIFTITIDGTPTNDLNTRLGNDSRIVFTTPEVGG